MGNINIYIYISQTNPQQILQTRTHEIKIHIKIRNNISKNSQRDSITKFTRNFPKEFTRRFHERVHKKISHENSQIDFTRELTKGIPQNNSRENFAKEFTRRFRKRIHTRSPSFYAPEMLENRLYDPFKADMWSIGCVVLEVLACHVSKKHNTLLDNRCEDQHTHAPTRMPSSTIIFFPHMAHYLTLIIVQTCPAARWPHLVQA